MNAQELFTKEGKSAGVWYCSECKYVSRTEAEGEQCCKPRACECGAECKGYWTACESCRETAQQKKIAERVEKAKKIPSREWSGPVVPEGSDGFHSLDLALDYYECEGIDVPKPIWGTRPNACHINAEDVIENATEELYEDAIGHVSADGTVALQTLLDGWLAEYGPPAGWVEDGSIVIELDPEAPK